MKPLFSLVAALLLLAAVLPADAQQQMKIVRRGPGGTETKTLSQDDMLVVPELSAILLVQDKAIVVDHIMEAGMRPKGYETTELKEGDKVLMVDGKKIETLKELRAHYEEATPGTTIKLGLRRGEEMVMAAFAKADPKLLPKTRMMIGGDDKEIMAIPAAGLFLTMKGDLIVVDKVLDNAAEAIHGGTAKEGDVITAINGQAVRSIDDLRGRYEKLSVGDKVELGAKRGPESVTLSFTKKKDEGKMVIRRRKD